VIDEHEQMGHIVGSDKLLNVTSSYSSLHLLPNFSSAHSDQPIITSRLTQNHLKVSCKLE